MKFFAKFFWFILPVAMLVGTYREANSTVLRYWTLREHREEVTDTQKDLNRIIMLIAANYKVSRKLPNNLQRFIEQTPSIERGKRERAKHLDAWLVPYQLHDLGDRYEVISCGPDRDCDNVLDNLVEGARKVAAQVEPANGGDENTDAVFKNLEMMNKAVDAHNKQLEALP